MKQTIMTDLEMFNAIFSKDSNYDLREYDEEEYPNYIRIEWDNRIMFMFNATTGKFEYSTTCY